MRSDYGTRVHPCEKLLLLRCAFGVCTFMVGRGRFRAHNLQLTFVTFEALYLRAFPQCYKIAVGKALSNLLPPRSVQAQFRHRALTSSRADKASDGQSARLATNGRRHANWSTPYFSGFYGYRRLTPDAVFSGQNNSTP